MNIKDYKGTWNRYKKGLLPRLIDIVVIIASVIVFKANVWWKFGIVVSLSIFLLGIISRYWAVKPIDWLGSIKNLPKSFMFAVIFFVLWKFLSAWSIIIAIVALAAWRMWQQKALIKETIGAGVDLLERK